MDIPHQIIFWVGNVLEAIILIRLLLTSSFGRYTLFSSYLLFVLLRSLADFWFLRYEPSLYPRVYWYVTEPLSALLGTLVIFELYRNVLEFYPGVARMARSLVAVVIALVVSRFLAALVLERAHNAGANELTLLRDLRIVQSVFVLGVVSLIAYYRIPMGRNLGGMVGGYGVYVGLGLFDMTLRAYLGSASQFWWSYFHPSAYLLILVVWTWSLWYCAPITMAGSVDRHDACDYRLLAESTIRHLDRAHDHLSKSVRP